VTLEERDEWSGELEVLRKNGTPLPLWLSITAVRSQEDEVTHYIYAASGHHRAQASRGRDPHPGVLRPR
jgi:hypothetical protein